MKTFCFTVDDNIRFLRELTEHPRDSLFDHPYPAMYRRFHEKYGLKVQLNLFYRDESFDLSQMTDRYRDEWAHNADWLKLSFHSDYENVKPYEFSSYDEVYRDCRAVHREIVRFASPAALAETTTIHYCLTTPEGLDALRDNGLRGLLGLYGDKQHPRTSYGCDEEEATRIREGEMIARDGVVYAPIDMVINGFDTQRAIATLAPMTVRQRLWIMIHEQYFYPDYQWYQPEFEQKLDAVFSLLTDKGYVSHFYEELL